MKKISMIMVMLVLTLVCTSSVYAGGPGPIEYTVGLKIQNTGAQLSDTTISLYEGDTITADVVVAEQYNDTTGEVYELTDFEIAVGEEVAIISNYTDAQFSKDSKKLYYIQLADFASKLVIPADTKLAVLEKKVDEGYFTEDEVYNSGLNCAKRSEISADFQLCFKDESVYTCNKSIKVEIIPFKTGDFNRDYEVDFFDITNLISTVYETGEEGLDWRVKAAIVSNTKEHADSSYDITTAELGFMDIIYLIKEVYG